MADKCNVLISGSFDGVHRGHVIFIIRSIFAASRILECPVEKVKLYALVTDEKRSIGQKVE